MTTKILDLPNMQKYDNKYADKFIKVLSETDNLEILNTVPVRAMIELKWPHVKRAMTKYLLYPYLALLFLFIIYAVYIFEYIQG